MLADNVGASLRGHPNLFLPETFATGQVADHVGNLQVAVAKYSRDSMVTAPALHDSGSTVSPAAVDLNE